MKTIIQLIITVLVFTLNSYLLAQCPYPNPNGGEPGPGYGCPNCIPYFPWPGNPFGFPVIHAFDPNDIVGPLGYADQRYVKARENLQYMIRFENDPDFATGPAQRVVVRMPVDPRYDLYSFRLNEFGFGQFRYQVPADQSFYRTRITNTVDSLGVFVDLTAGIDVQKNEAFWIFESIDPKTGLRPEDALRGFLPVNDTTINRFNDTLTKRGEGFATFTILPHQGIASGDTCKAKASIVFDINPAIATNLWTNIVDAIAPQSKLKAIPKTSPANTILLQWTAEDDPKGSGLSYYDLYVSKNESPFYLYQGDIDTTFFLFAGEALAKYAFYVRATDHVGNKEAPKNMAEAATTLGVVGSLALNSPRLGSSYCSGDTLTIQWQATNAGERFALYYSADQGKTFSLIKSEVSAGTKYSWYIPKNATAGANSIIQIRSLDDDRFVANSAVFSLYPSPQVDLGPDVQLIKGDSVTLANKGSMGAGYRWSTGATSQSIRVKTPGVYSLEVVSENGCKSRDSITVSSSVSTIDPVFVQSFKLFPNPVENALNVQFDLKQAANLTLIIQDAQGKQTLQRPIGKIGAGRFTQLFEVDGLSAGSYLVLVKNGNRRIAVGQFLKY